MLEDRAQIYFSDIIRPVIIEIAAERTQTCLAAIKLEEEVRCGIFFGHLCTYTAGG
jgi:hypothetical protein